MFISYDPEAEAVYAYMIDDMIDVPGSAANTICGYPINIDLTSDGRVLGIEILHAQELLDSEFLKRFDIHPTKVDDRDNQYLIGKVKEFCKVNENECEDLLPYLDN